MNEPSQARGTSPPNVESRGWRWTPQKEPIELDEPHCMSCRGTLRAVPAILTPPRGEPLEGLAVVCSSCAAVDLLDELGAHVVTLPGVVPSSSHP